MIDAAHAYRMIVVSWDRLAFSQRRHAYAVDYIKLSLVVQNAKLMDIAYCSILTEGHILLQLTI